jgi:hypothetical protein
VLTSLALLTGCSGSSSGSGAKPTGPAPTAKSGELDKLMRTKMNAAYSQLVFLVFHADEPNYEAISMEGAKLSDAISGVLQLQVPPVAQSEQARQVYVDYNETLRRDNEKFVAATVERNLATMSTSLTKIGETCSACHHFFRVEKVEIKK